MQSRLFLRRLTALMAVCGLFGVVGCASKNAADKPYVTASQGPGRTVYLRRPMALWLPAHTESKDYPFVLMEGKLAAHPAGGPNGVMPEGQVVAVLPAGSRLQIERAQGYRMLDEFAVTALGSFEDPASRKSVRFQYIYHNAFPIPWSVVPPT